MSEGRDAGAIEAITASVRDTPGVTLIHCSADPDHNRMVLAYTGAADDVLQASRRLAAVVFERVDLRRHEGQHPRLGALDVVPFVSSHPPGSDVHENALSTCRSFAEWVGLQGVPVFLYEDAATTPVRRPLPTVRRGGFEGLAARMLLPEWAPDHGPGAPHESAGAVITGVRRPLVRFNVNLRDPDPSVARTIASEIRETGGGLEAVRALGLSLGSRDSSQVTVNLTDYRKTSLASLYDAILRGARELGGEVVGNEVIGPIPRAALRGVGPDILESLDPQQVLEEI